MFSKSLDLEYRQFGISCHNQAPAYVATKMSKIRKPTMDAPSPANWVKAAIAHIGYEVTQCPFPCVPTPPWNNLTHFVTLTQMRSSLAAEERQLHSCVRDTYGLWAGRRQSPLTDTAFLACMHVRYLTPRETTFLGTLNGSHDAATELSGMNVGMALGLDMTNAVRRRSDGVQVSRCDVGHCEQCATVCREPVPAALPSAAAQEVLQEAGARSCQGQGPVRCTADHGRGHAVASAVLSAVLQKCSSSWALVKKCCFLQSSATSIMEYYCTLLIGRAQTNSRCTNSSAIVCSVPVDSVNISTGDKPGPCLGLLVFAKLLQLTCFACNCFTAQRSNCITMIAI